MNDTWCRKMQSIDKEEVDIRKLSVYANLDIWSNKKKTMFGGNI